MEARLADIAAARGCDAEALAREALEQFLDYDQWFLAEVEKGLAQIARDETLSHEEVGRSLEQLLSRKRSGA
ncbi:MAG TPA: hypothetical protein VKV17_06125 [Bryobacteraceae bacterium]|nr:hypothetical protein [Bryobacteraceae bacterium]